MSDTVFCASCRNPVEPGWSPKVQMYRDDSVGSYVARIRLFICDSCKAQGIVERDVADYWNDLLIKVVESPKIGHYRAQRDAVGA